MSKNILYFAYGSNLNQEDLNQWKAKKPKWKNTDLTMHKVSIAYLLGHRLGFTRTAPSRENMGVADIVESDDPQSRVWGVIFALTPEQDRAIADKEGSPNSYKPIKIEVVDEKGSRHMCLTYLAVVENEKKRKYLYHMPSEKYYEVIRKGGKEHGLPEEFFEHLKTASFTERNPVAIRMNDTSGMVFLTPEEAAKRSRPSIKERLKQMRLKHSPKTS